MHILLTHAFKAPAPPVFKGVNSFQEFLAAGLPWLLILPRVIGHKLNGNPYFLDPVKRARARASYSLWTGRMSGASESCCATWKQIRPRSSSCSGNPSRTCSAWEKLSRAACNRPRSSSTRAWSSQLSAIAAVSSDDSSPLWASARCLASTTSSTEFSSAPRRYRAVARFMAVRMGPFRRCSIPPNQVQWASAGLRAARMTVIAASTSAWSLTTMLTSSDGPCTSTVVSGGRRPSQDLIASRLPLIPSGATIRLTTLLPAASTRSATSITPPRVGRTTRQSPRRHRSSARLSGTWTKTILKSPRSDHACPPKLATRGTTLANGT